MACAGWEWAMIYPDTQCVLNVTVVDVSTLHASEYVHVSVKQCLTVCQCYRSDDMIHEEMKWKCREKVKV